METLFETHAKSLYEKSYKMIAEALNLSYETVHSHIKKIYHKLQVNSVGEAVSKTISGNILRTFTF